MESNLEELILREMIEEDIPKIYKELNLKYVEKYCSDALEEQKEAYEKWYSFVLNSPYYVMYTISNKEDEFLGNIRFELHKKRGVINIYLSPKIRGKNLSKIIIENSIEKLRTNKKIDIIEAYILEENDVSIHLFEKLGFKFSKNARYNGIKHKKYMKKVGI